MSDFTFGFLNSQDGIFISSSGNPPTSETVEPFPQVRGEFSYAPISLVILTYHCHVGKAGK